ADMDVDMAGGVSADLSTGDVDMAMGDMACAIGPEVCGNGCDDDRNGYTDDDDPACTSQMLVTFTAQSPALWRLILEPKPHVAVLDGNPVGIGGMSTLQGAFSPAAFVAYDASTKKLEKRPPGGTASTFTVPGAWATTRDVCVFNGELIVVDARPPATTYLHRFINNNKTKILPTITLTNLSSACSS